jgi:hypothetical protein
MTPERVAELKAAEELKFQRERAATGEQGAARGPTADELVAQAEACMARYMQEQGLSLEFFSKIWTGEQNPWEKLAQNDVNNQMVCFENAHNHFAK